MTPSTEQKVVLNNKARVRLVRAAPGSGKTWLVAELIRIELEERRKDAIAALSFTRVGGEEIRRAVGHNLQHPHFVGTLDAFLFRFIVRPFWPTVFPEWTVPRLIPAEWAPKEWKKGPNNTNFTVDVGQGAAKQVFNLFNVVFLSENNEVPVIACKQWDWDSNVILEAESTKRVLEAKNKLWKKYGWVTHSDASYLAYKILCDSTYGGIIRKEVIRRFGLLIVDELQDTGWFLGKCVLSLLSVPSARGVLVGDPDQAIYEFNGARPDLFDSFKELDGVEEIPLGRTMRCCQAICTVAKHLSQSNRDIEPAPGKAGRAFLLSYGDFNRDIHKLREWLGNNRGTGTKIVARQLKTVEKISGFTTKDAPKLGSRPLNHLHRAVNCFRQGRRVAALAAAYAALELVVFDHEGVSEKELVDKNILPLTWKRFSVETLLEANREVHNETFEIWGGRICDFIKKGMASVFPPDSGCTCQKIRSPKTPEKLEIRQNYLIVNTTNISNDGNVPVYTVHAVKGETHDFTVLICPNSTANHCPSEVWWSTAATDQEERRIAYVATTRSRGDFAVCVSEQCLTRLQQKRADFVGSFQLMTIDNFIATDGGRTVALGFSAQPPQYGVQI